MLAQNVCYRCGPAKDRMFMLRGRDGSRATCLASRPKKHVTCHDLNLLMLTWYGYGTAQV